jgi:hypothetical protein
VGFHIALSDDKQGVDFHLFGALDHLAFMASAALQYQCSNRPGFPTSPQTSEA